MPQSSHIHINHPTTNATKLYLNRVIKGSEVTAVYGGVRNSSKKELEKDFVGVDTDYVLVGIFGHEA